MSLNCSPIRDNHETAMVTVCREMWCHDHRVVVLKDTPHNIVRWAMAITLTVTQGRYSHAQHYTSQVNEGLESTSCGWGIWAWSWTWRSPWSPSVWRLGSPSPWPFCDASVWQTCQPQCTPSESQHLQHYRHCLVIICILPASCMFGRDDWGECMNWV